MDGGRVACRGRTELGGNGLRPCGDGSPQRAAAGPKPCGGLVVREGPGTGGEIISMRLG